MQDIQLTITSNMRTAAQGVAVTHQHYMGHCHIMPKLKGKPEAMAITLTQRKEAHRAYHLALGFLKAATLKANPQFGNIPEPRLQERLNQWLDTQLNQLIRETGQQSVEITEHWVMRAPQEWRWA